jgi:hypothetical protein
MPGKAQFSGQKTATSKNPTLPCVWNRDNQDRPPPMLLAGAEPVRSACICPKNHFRTNKASEAVYP